MGYLCGSDTEIVEVYLPDQFAVSGRVSENPIIQLLRPEIRKPLPVAAAGEPGGNGFLVHLDNGERILVVDSLPPAESFAGDVLLVPSRSLAQPERALRRTDKKRWVKQRTPLVTFTGNAHLGERVQEVRGSWTGRFSYTAEDPSAGQVGLRVPQIGALHATLAHWSVSPEEVATIVMPTGTGKTETMLALLVNQRLPRLLVVVPTDALREQIMRKFLTLGMLKPDVVAPETLYPIVGKFKRQFTDPDAARAFFASCNVVVATMQVVNGCSEEIRRVICELCSHLIIDEAHHVKAPSWEGFRTRFHGKPILQFTATPYRNDGKHVGGRMIYNYPLFKAQQEGYFTKIQYRPVFALSHPDRAVAQAAVDQLRGDLERYDHIVMARVETIARAEEIHAIYQEIAPEFCPRIIHSDLKAVPRREALKALRDRTSRIIVCVNMLGEGFDFPELKIAALHDVHKSLAITLQFTGRFTRARTDLGEATMIANRANLDVSKKLRALYAEDADWDLIIRELGQEATGEQMAQSEFNRTFTTLPKEVPLQVVEPKMSTVVYRTTCEEWNPYGVLQVFPEDILYTKELSVSPQHRVLWFVTRETAEIRWGELRELENVTYNLYLLHWDEERNLLFINSSNNDSLHEALAKAVAGEDTKIIDGPNVYRAMHGVQRLVPTNLGLLDHVSHSNRFMQLTGADVVEGLEPSQRQTRSKTNIFGYGFENGERTSIGCSKKGRIWSFLVARAFSQWVRWCHHIGGKLLDDSIDPNEVIRGFIKPKYVTGRPALVPLSIEWPLAFLQEQEDRIDVVVNGQPSLFFDVSLEILDHQREGPIRFRVESGHGRVEYEAVFTPQGIRYEARGKEALITKYKTSKPLSEWFRQYAPKFYFEQDTFIEHNLLLHPDRSIPPYDPSAIKAWDWSGVNIKRESQGPDKVSGTIQHRVIENLLAPGDGWDLVFDDDDAREVADVVAMKMEVDRLVVHLYHCKFSKEAFTGSRIDDLYAVCGQAQKSSQWRETTGYANLIPHLVQRERSRLEAGSASRFEKGDMKTLEEIAQRREVLRPEFKVYLVQPGLSRAMVTPEVLDLLAATALYLRESFNIGFGVIASE